MLPSLIPMKSPRVLTLAVVLLSLSCGRALAGNAVIDWNLKALDATRLARNPPPHSALYLATYHIAIFDAVNGITHQYHGWLVNDLAPAGANVDAAIASASITVLNSLWTWTNPRTLQIAYDKAMADIRTANPRWTAWPGARRSPRPSSRSALTAATTSRSPASIPPPSLASGVRRPPHFAPRHFPSGARSRPFVITTQSQFRAPPPHTIGSKEYADEIALVNKIGGPATARTEQSTRPSARPSGPTTWGPPRRRATGTSSPRTSPAGRTSQSSRRRGSSPSSTWPRPTRAITIWETKFFYSTWRPETAIREMDKTIEQGRRPESRFSSRTSLRPRSPPTPSGHSGFSAAAARILALFFGTDEVAFSIGSDGLPGVVHSFRPDSRTRRLRGGHEPRLGRHPHHVGQP